VIMVMGFLFSLFGCSKKDNDGGGPTRYVAEQAYKDNLAKQASMTPQTMDQLREHGVTQTATLRIEFFFYTDTERKAGSLAEALRAMGYQAEAGPSAGDDKLFLVNGWTTPLKMDDAAVLDWTRQMCKLGYEHDCEFDGWGTNPSQSEGHADSDEPARSPARQEMDDLLDNGIRSAAHFLEKSGEFYPFGLALRPDGEIAHVAAWDGKSEHPKSDDVLVLLYQALRQGVENGEYKAIAIVTDVTIRKTPNDPPRDAVRVQIEHPDAAPVACFLPYSIENGKCVQGQLTAERAEPLIIGTEE
jgi:regulator of RNase E activity RraB